MRSRSSEPALLRDFHKVAPRPTYGTELWAADITQPHREEENQARFWVLTAVFTKWPELIYFESLSLNSLLMKMKMEPSPHPTQGLGVTSLRSFSPRISPIQRGGHVRSRSRTMRRTSTVNHRTTEKCLGKGPRGPPVRPGCSPVRW